jgi:hypothetical protein
MGVTPRLRPLPAQEQRSNNIVTALLQAPGTAPAAGGRRWRGAFRTPARDAGAGRDCIALHRPSRRPQERPCPGDRAAHREYLGDGPRGRGLPRESCGRSRAHARPNKTCTLQDLGPRPALSAVPAGERYRGKSRAKEVVPAGKGSILVHLRTWPWPPSGAGIARAHDFLESGFPCEIMLQGLRCLDQAARSMGCEMRPWLALVAVCWRGLHRRSVTVRALRPGPCLSFLEKKRGLRQITIKGSNRRLFIVPDAPGGGAPPP